MALPLYPDTLDHPESWKDLDTPDALGHFEEVLFAAANHGVLNDLPASPEESRTAPGKNNDFADYQVRARVIGERLWLLGYIKLKDREGARNLLQANRSDFLSAVTLFQQEAGLNQDGWVGKKTWTLLSNLVNFEPLPAKARLTDHTIPVKEAWQNLLGAGLNNRAVMRAAALRLHVLGLTNHSPGKGTPYRRPSQPAVKDFHRLLWSLGLVNKLYGDRLNKTTLPLLMNHDLIVETVGSLNDSDNDRFTLVRPAEWAEEAFKDKAQLFLTRLVQVELWLLGSDIDLQTARRYPVSGIRQRPVADPFNEQNFSEGDFFDPKGELEDRLREYYQEFLGLSKNRSRRQAEEIRPSLFRSFLNPHSSRITAHTAKLNESDAYESIVGSIETSAAAEKLLDTGRTLGLRIWDGLKRIWRWFKRQITQVIQFGNNLARAFYRYASKGFSIVKRAIRSVISSVKLYVSGDFSHSGIDIKIGRDFDTTLTVPEKSPGTSLQTAGLYLQLFSSRFVFACRILGLIFDTFVLSTMQRWARLAISLAGELKTLLSLYREMVSLEGKLSIII